MTSLCWRSMTSSFAAHTFGTASPSTRTSMRDANTSSLHDGSIPPKPQSVDTINHRRMNPLPSTAISSSSSGELYLYIESDTSSHSIPAGPPSSSQELLLQGDQLVPQPPPIFATATHTSISTSQPPPQSTSISSWTDEVAIAEQSGCSTPETFVQNWAHSGRIHGPRPRSQPLVYQPPVIPQPFSKRPRVPSPQYRPAIPPLRPQTSFPDRPTSTVNDPCTDPSLRRRPRITAREISAVCSSLIQGSKSPTRHAAKHPKRPTALILKMKSKPLFSHTRDHSQSTRTKLSFSPNLKSSRH